MTEDKTLDYHILKNLHYQNEYSHFIYRNTFKTAMQQRTGNFWKIIEIPAIILTLLDLFIIFFTTNLVIGGLFILISTVGGIFIGIWLYNHFIKTKNKRDIELMEFNNILIWIQNSKDQVNILKKYKIEGVDSILLSKMEEIEDLIEFNLFEAFKKYNGQTINYLENFLTGLGLTSSRLKGRLERLSDFVKNNFENYDQKKYYVKLNGLIKLLENFADKSDDSKIIIPYYDNEDFQMKDHPRAPPEGCFIATAAYGSPITPQVSFLRHIRDDVLKKDKIGLKFVESYERIYYKFSPFIADIMNQRFHFKSYMKWVIVNPIVWSLGFLFLSLKIIRKNILKRVKVEI